MVGGVVVKKILAAIDRSKYKEKIIDYAISMGKAWGAEVTAIHVIDPGRGVPGGRIKEKEKQREEEAERPAQDLLSEDELQAKKEGINLRKEIVEESDTVEKAIIDYAKKSRRCNINWYFRYECSRRGISRKCCKQCHTPRALSCVCNSLICSDLSAAVTYAHF